MPVACVVVKGSNAHAGCRARSICFQTSCVAVFQRKAGNEIQRVYTMYEALSSGQKERPGAVRALETSTWHLATKPRSIRYLVS